MSKELPKEPALEEPDWADTSLAIEEEERWDKENELRGQERTNKLWVLKVFGWLVPIMMVIFSILFIVCLTFWTWHLLTPDNWHWLSDEQSNKIQSVIFSGSIGALVSAYIQKNFIT